MLAIPYANKDCLGMKLTAYINNEQQSTQAGVSREPNNKNQKINGEISH